MNCAAASVAAFFFASNPFSPAACALFAHSSCAPGRGTRYRAEIWLFA
jgi:hypothetical protein